jgi:hypothetical protein
VVKGAPFRLRFRDGTALLRHSFIRLAFRDAWEGILCRNDRAPVMEALERRLNAAAAERGLCLTVPVACFVARAHG